ELDIGVLEPGRGCDAGAVAVEVHAVLVADAVERREHRAAEARGFFQDRVDGLAAGVLEAESGEGRLHAEQVVEGEADFAQRRGIAAHRESTCWGRVSAGRRAGPARGSSGCRA